jgi:peptidoglycan/LPS O-acetylase OafA/YrhL
MHPESATANGPATDLTAAAPASRFVGLDALRGVAAVMVMLFHYTTRYEEKFGHTTAPAFTLPWGHLGVDLFFMISGFVIFMTLERTVRPRDFLVSRLSRLFPTYWVAVVFTFAVLAAFPQIHKDVAAVQAAQNLLMFHGLFGVAHIDGVYWTLEVELLFYWVMFLLWLTGRLGSTGKWIAPWLALCIGFGLAKQGGVAFPYTISRVLILPYFAYFALGILLYGYYKARRFRWSTEGALGAMALLAIGLVDSAPRVLWAAGFIGVFLLFISRFGSARPVVALSGLGAISYPLYLLHENAGWTLISYLEVSGIGANTAIAVTSATAIAAAALLHYCVEGPSMRAIRSWRRGERGSEPSDHRAVSRVRWATGAMLLGMVLLIGSRLAPAG